MIFSIVFWAFLVGLNNLYWYYEPTVREVVEVHSQHIGVNLVTRAEGAFGTCVYSILILTNLESVRYYFIDEEFEFMYLYQMYCIIS